MEAITPTIEIHEPDTVKVRTIGELDALLTSRHLAFMNGKLPRVVVDDPTAWEGVDRLAKIVLAYTGRPMDWTTICTWVEPRLRFYGERDPRALTIARAAELIDGKPDLICPRCRGWLHDRDFDRWCERCRQAATDEFVASMGHLMQRERLFPKTEFVDLVDPKIRHFGREIAGEDGHPTFTLATWRVVLDWLEAKHGLSGSGLAKTTRAEVIELLRAGVDSPATEAKSGPVQATEASPEPILAASGNLVTIDPVELMRKHQPKSAISIAFLEYMRDRPRGRA